jgi:hypothetical protein
MESKSPPDRDLIVATLLRLAGERAPDKTLDPAEVARALGGPHPDGWGPLMQPIRRAVIDLAKEGRLIILRKGKPIAPADLKGIYRLRLPAPDQQADA